MGDTFDPLRILAALRAHGVSFVVVGGMASVARGVSLETDDLDVSIPGDHENLQRLVQAVEDLKADPSPSAVEEHRVTFTTGAGRLDCLELSPEFEDLWVRAEAVDFGHGIVARVASIEDLFDAKRASGDLSGAAAMAALIPTPIAIEHEEGTEADEEPEPHGVHRVLKVLEGVDTWLTDLTNGTGHHHDRTRS
jgi:hypothetical protein